MKFSEAVELYLWVVSVWPVSPGHENGSPIGHTSTAPITARCVKDASRSAACPFFREVPYVRQSVSLHPAATVSLPSNLLPTPQFDGGT